MIEIPKDKKNLIVLVVLGIIGAILLYFMSVKPMMGGSSANEPEKANVVEELPTAQPIDIMGKSINNKLIAPIPEEEQEAVEAVFQERQATLAEHDILEEFNVELTDEATDQERMMRILELQERFRTNNANFAADLARQQAEEEKAALQKEVNTYKELYEQSVSDNNEMALRIQKAEDEIQPELQEREWLRVTTKRGDVVSSLGTEATSKSPFHGGSTTQSDDPTSMRNALKATIQQTITVKDGDLLPLRLSEDVYAGNTVLKAGTVVNGVVHLSGKRLHVTVTNIEYRGRIMEVNLAVYDVDAQRGIYVPEGDIAQAVNEATTALGDGIMQASTSSSLGYTINQSASDAVTGIAVRGAIAGVGSMLKGKQRIPTVTIHSGYKLFLMNQ